MSDPRKRQALVAAGALAVVIAAISTYASWSSAERLVEGYRQRELTAAATLIQNDIQEQIGKAAARAGLVVNMPSVQAAMRAQNRDDLVRILESAFLMQRDRYGVREGQFHLAPATSFLRIYDVKAGHGEDLSSFREMVVTTNHKQVAQKGIEVGRRGLSIRGVEVIKDAKGPVGSFEVGMSFSTIIENMKRNTGFEGGVFVDDALMTRVATLIPRPEPERILAGYRNVEATNWQVIRPMVTADLLARSKDIVTRMQSVGGIDYGMVLVPMLDYKGAHIGTIVAVKSFEEYQRQSNAGLVRAVGFALLEALILMGALLFIINVTLRATPGGEDAKPPAK